MNSHPAQPIPVSPAFIENLHPSPFAATIAQLQTMALVEFDREINEKQLCYHTRDHIAGVQRRANQIFHIIRADLQVTDDRDRLEALLDLCAVTHDLIQIFTPQAAPHTSRYRKAGVSEAATIERVLQLIDTLNQQQANNHDAARFSHHELLILQEAILATICEYAPIEQAIFQPALYQHNRPISLIARTLALADIGALGMEGIAAYNTEGSLLFLEENPDVRSLVENHHIATLSSRDAVLSENIRQRLLKRARFQVNFAKSRLKRCPQELAAFPPEAIPVLTHEVFRYLTPETIQEIESSTPTAEDTPLAILLNFFQFEQALTGVKP